MAGIRDRVKALIAQGKTLDQVIAAKPTAQWDATWGKGFMGPDVFVSFVHRSLTETKPAGTEVTEPLRAGGSSGRRGGRSPSSSRWPAPFAGLVDLQAFAFAFSRQNARVVRGDAVVSRASRPGWPCCRLPAWCCSGVGGRSACSATSGWR